MRSKIRKNILCTKMYHGHPRQLNVKITRLWSAFLKYFICKDTNNHTIENHSSIYVNDNTSYENPATCHSVLSKEPYNYTYKYTPAHTRSWIPPWKTVIFLSLTIFTYVYHQHPQKFVTTFIKNLHSFWNYDKLETRFYQKNRMGTLQETWTSWNILVLSYHTLLYTY